jgi:hypothetical protein
MRYSLEAKNGVVPALTTSLGALSASTSVCRDKIERLNGEIRDREKVIRGLKK